ncbi:MAG: chitobiase/beta-hexosaminidase C-terminal domain-containing protein [Bacteroidales bacterium]|nr:chitobiase/beta-hexosaminidase C-terminal domain-containing protein [Bacteroidales bacterium]
MPSEACVLELQAKDGGTWAFYDALYNDLKGGYLYAAGNSKNNYLRTQATLDNNCKATVDITSDGVATIKFQGSYTNNWLRYNPNNGKPWFSCYGAKSKLQDVYLYHYVAPTGTTDPELSYSPSTLTIAANGTLTQPTLNNPNKVTIKSYSSSNTSVATVTDKGVIALAGGTGTATITATSQANDTYKAGTATYTLTVFGAPEITPESGEYENNVTVVMNATGAGALFYTTDGTDPKDAIDAATKVTEFPYNLPLSVGTHTIKAVTADKSLEVYSDVLTRTYTVVLAVPTPQLSQAAGNYNYEVAVDVTVANSGGAVGYVYTTDGTDPATSATATTVNALTGKVTLYKGVHTLTVKSFTAEKANFSDAATAAYTVSLPQPVITLSAESTQEQPITVTIEAEGAPYIWYTTDGTDPLAKGATPIQVEGSSTNFTLSKVGTYTITAVGVNNDAETSDAATATCTITKVVPVPGSATMKYKKVTSEDDIVDGGVYIVVCETKKTALGNIGTDRGYKVDVELVGDTYNGTVNGESLPYEFQINKRENPAANEGKYTIYIPNQSAYLYANSTKSTDHKIQNLPSIDSNLAYWNISLSSGDVLISSPASGNQVLRCNITNNTTGEGMYRIYDPKSTTGAQIQLYKKTFDLSVNANTAGYATAYTTFPYVMPTGANGYIVTETAEGETIKAKQKYPAGAEVPANAPLLIKNADAGVTLNPVVLGKTVEAYPYAEENLLHGTRLESDGVTTDVDGTGTNTANYYYYKLSYKLDAEKNPVAKSYGFYRGNADGSAFEMKNTLTAYLARPRSSGLVNSLRISIDNEEGTTTGIQANRIPADKMPQSIYTLSGVRVNAAGGSLPKGIYIVNGKKVVIK